MTRKDEKPDTAFQIAPPARREAGKPQPGAPDLRIEEIEERHVPRDRNIFDK